MTPPATQRFERPRPSPPAPRRAALPGFHSPDDGATSSRIGEGGRPNNTLQARWTFRRGHVPSREGPQTGQPDPRYGENDPMADLHQNRVRPGVESLEDRQLLSAGLTPAPHVPPIQHQSISCI